MSDPRERKSDPLPGVAISENSSASSVPEHAQPVTDSASFFVNCHAVLVQGKATRRHLFFSLPAAEKCVLRATARGHLAEMVLVQLVPVQIIPLRGGEDD